MALDLGEKRIGVAVSDELRMIARSHSVVKRTSRVADYAKYANIIAQEQITLLVVGLPVTLGGEEGSKAKWTRDYAGQFAEQVNIPIVFFDEALTTVEAEASMRARNIRGKKARAQVDAVAAAFILQNYLDAQAASSEWQVASGE